MKHNQSMLRLGSCILAILLCAAWMTGCRSADTQPHETDTTAQTDLTDNTDVGTLQPTDPNGDPAETVTPDTVAEAETVEDPTQGTYSDTDKLTATVNLTGNGADVEGQGVSVQSNTVTFTAAGTYLLTGSLQGQLVIDTQDTDKVKLLLNGVSVTCADGPAVLVRNAPKKVILYTVKDSVNLFADTAGYVVADEAQTEGETYPNACIYACADLKLDGEGVMQVTGNADKGINTKDDLEICGGDIRVTGKGAGIRGNDSVTVTGGTVTVTAGGDGIKTAETEKEGKGVLTVEDGYVSVTATGDALNAATDLTVTGGTIVITTKDSDGKTVTEKSSSSGSGSRGGRGGFGGGGMDGNQNKPSISAKGLKAGGTITVNNGKLTISTVDDGIHSNDTVLINGGSLWIQSGDDGIHADKTLTIGGGVTEIVQSYEGLEADKINVLGGTNRITASDDGMNASNGTSSGGFGPGGGGRPGGGGWGGWGGSSGTTDTSDSPLLTIGGGYTVVNAGGDGIDSNGNIVMTGGTLYVYGPTDNGNGPIDFGDGNYAMTISGGTLLAVGSSGMAESPDNAGQAAWAVRLNSLSAGTLIGLADEDGNLICGFKIPKQIASMVFSCPEMKAGEGYTMVKGGTAEADADGVIDLSTWTGYSKVGTKDAY